MKEAVDKASDSVAGPPVVRLTPTRYSYVTDDIAISLLRPLGLPTEIP